VGGPWFTVQAVQGGWQKVDSLWVSNGQGDVKARLELRVSFSPFPETKHTK